MPDLNADPKVHVVCISIVNYNYHHHYDVNVSHFAVNRVPDLNADPVLYPVQKSVKEQNSLASYIALVMTKYGSR